MKRRFIPLWKALQEARNFFGYPESYGICACYEVENMGFCEDGISRWYHFTDINGNPAYTIKR